MATYKQVKSQVDKLRKQSEQAQGAMQVLLGTLAKQFDCHSIEEGKAFLAELQGKQEKLKKTIQKKLESFDKKYKDVLEGAAD